MNCKQANSIPIRQVLAHFSLFPSKENTHAGFYYALDRKEKTPSLHVDFSRNTAFDFGTGRKYDVVNIVQMIRRCSMSDALDFLSGFEFPAIPVKRSGREARDDYTITTVKPVGHPSLVAYLKARKLDPVSCLLSEVHYRSGSKTYFGVGFQNDTGGYEFSNSIGLKCCLGAKNITTFSSGNPTLCVFEGWSDYLSYQVLTKVLDLDPKDTIVLNSVSLVNRILDTCRHYEQVELYLDNDPAGDRATGLILQAYGQASDQRFWYRDYKDLNEFLVSGRANQKPFSS